MADFNQLLKVLRRETPDRPVLFELFMNGGLYNEALNGRYDDSAPYARLLSTARAFEALGYDYATAQGFCFSFPSKREQHEKTVSLNRGFMITDRESFDSYPWPDPYDYDYDIFDRIAGDLPSGMKLMIMGPCGVLENAIALMGYDNLCIALYDDEQLVYDVFEQVGDRLLKFYEKAAEYDSIGLICSNDDWGFNTQTMLSVEDMRRFVFPWHKKIVEAAHNAGKPAVLHSCGNFSQILDDLKALGFDGRHSYEDKIMPVEEAYDVLSNDMAVLGGIDVDFLIRESEGAIRSRVRAMLEKTGCRAWAVGSGNSIPEYVPIPKYMAMNKEARKN